MMTMKAAFETKLRLAREEADASSRKHQQEIIRMHATSPYLAASAAAARAAAGGGSGSGIGGGSAAGAAAGVPPRR